MIDCTSEVMSFSIYLYKNFIKVPLPVARLQAPGPSLFDLAYELRAKPLSSPQIMYHFSIEFLELAVSCLGLGEGGCDCTALAMH